MDFRIPSATKLLFHDVREFVADNVQPIEQRFLAEGFHSVASDLEGLRREVRQRGWWLPQLGKEHGGMGLGLVGYGLFCEELGRSPLGLYAFNCQAPDAGNMEILLKYSSPQVRQQYVDRLLAGEIRSCFGMTEPEHAGSNPVWMSTTAVKEGGDYVLSGHKWYASGADGAAFSVVMAVTDPAAQPHLRASMFIVPSDTHGYHLIRNIPVMGEAGEGWASHGEILLDNCRIPPEYLLGEEGAGFRIAQERLGPGRIHHCMRWIGVCERCFEIMCRHAASRELSPGRPLGSMEIIQGWIAESRAEIDSARLLVLHTAWVIENHGAKAARTEISTIKFHVAGVLQRVIDRSLQTLGGLGMSDYTPVAYFYRHERAARIYDGPDEVHKQSVARQTLKSYGLELPTQAAT